MRAWDLMWRPGALLSNRFSLPYPYHTASRQAWVVGFLTMLASLRFGASHTQFLLKDNA